MLSINQSGFQNSCFESFKLYCLMVIDNGDFCASLFIDLSKAFDTVDHEILLHRLKSVDLSSLVIPWFKNYLSGRTQCVQDEGKLSESLDIAKGVPQGSVLGPLLFTIYINSMVMAFRMPNLIFMQMILSCIAVLLLDSKPCISFS